MNVSEGRRYRVLGVLGRGGFGTVYRAELLGEGGFVRQVALKVLNPNMEGVSEVASRLRDEARVLGLLRHRAILQVDGLVRLDDRWTVVMEYVEGTDLGTFPGALPPGVCLEIVGEVASALHVAYATPGPSGEPLRLLHRDIKPGNILLTSAGEVKVLDFGIAKANFGNREAKTNNLLFGSPGYIAPERLDFVEAPAGDVYSVGCVFFEILDGEAFGKASPRPERHAEIINAGRARLTKRGIPKPIIDFCCEMLAYDPTQRPTARDVESRSRDLRASLPRPWLRDWAEQIVPPMLVNRGLGGEHDFSDNILSERANTGPADFGATQMPAGGTRTFDDSFLDMTPSPNQLPPNANPPAKMPVVAQKPTSAAIPAPKSVGAPPLPPTLGKTATPRPNPAVKSNPGQRTPPGKSSPGQAAPGAVKRPPKADSGFATALVVTTTFVFIALGVVGLFSVLLLLFLVAAGM